MDKSPFGKRLPRGSIGGRSSASSVSNASGRRYTLGPTLNTPTMRKTMGSIGTSNSRQSISGRSTQSLMGIRSEYNSVESYGFQLPVLVTEALTFSEKNQHITVMFLPNGYAWLVHGRRLLIWQYKGINASPPRSIKDLRGTQRRFGSVAQCRELTLPHCDIGQKASLVSVFVGGNQQIASCLAVTPTGDARFWPSIAHDGSSIDATNLLDGQEFDKLIYIPEQNGYFLVTTTCSLVFLQLKNSNGRQVIQYRTLKQPTGFLGGFGKRFASILIGMNSGNERENKFISLACIQSDEQSAILTVLADKWVQNWRLTNEGQTEQLIFEDTELLRKIREEFQQKFWNVRAENLDVVIHLLDMHFYEGKYYFLAGGVNISHTPQMYYGIAVASVKQNSIEMLQFVPLKVIQFYNSTTEQECLNLRFIVASPYLYIYTDKVIYPLHLNNQNAGEIEAEKIEFHLQDDKILSASVCSNIPLFFSRSHGLISISPGDFDSSEFINNSPSVFDSFSGFQNDSLLQDQTLAASSVNDNNLYMYDLDPDVIYEEFKDEVSQLKAAFVYRLKKNNTMCNQIITDLMRNTGQNQTANLSDLDRIVIKIAEDLAEDMPAADPRWEHIWEEFVGSKHALGSSSSLQIITQLKEKSSALKHFVEFLHSTNIWDKLNGVPIGGGSILKSTSQIISDIHEKIIGAVALRSVQNKYAKIVDDTIKDIVFKWKESLPGNLTVHDIFYVHICKFQDFFSSLVEVSSKRVQSNHSANTIASNISDINFIILHILKAVQSAREENQILFALSGDKKEHYELLPWTAMAGKLGVRDSLLDLVDLTVKYGARATNQPEIKTKLYGQLLELIDIILDGRITYLESVTDQDKYQILEQQFVSQRRDLIAILMQDKQYELAAKLAEKYLDFQSLVAICEETDNRDRLDAYIKQFEEYDFSQFAINWHLRQNRQGEVFERFKGNQAALSQFMHDHPTLGWIQLMLNDDFERSSKILFNLAQSETEYVLRKETMLSLAKLASLASMDSDMNDQLDSINRELNLIQYQSQLGDQILETYGYDIENRKVLKVEEIINLFICEENETSNEFDFRKALELLRYLDDPYEARLKIWCSAILRDDWTDFNMNAALDYLQNTMFFKLVDVCNLIDENIDICLPPMEELLNCHEISHIVDNKAFQYLLKLAYEHIQKTFKTTTEGMDTEN